MAANNGTGQGVNEVKANPPSDGQVNEKVNKKPGEEKESRISSLARKVGYSFLLLIIGMLIVTLILYLPTRSDLTEAQNELERLSEIESRYNELQNDYSKLQKRAQVYKLISNSALLEPALLQEDETRIAQQIRYIEEDLSQLEIANFSEVKERLESTFSEIRQASTSDSETAREELRMFISDLFLLIDNLE